MPKPIPVFSLRLSEYKARVNALIEDKSVEKAHAQLLAAIKKVTHHTPREMKSQKLNDEIHQKLTNLELVLKQYDARKKQAKPFYRTDSDYFDSKAQLIPSFHEIRTDINKLHEKFQKKKQRLTASQSTPESYASIAPPAQETPAPETISPVSLPSRHTQRIRSKTPLSLYKTSLQPIIESDVPADKTVTKLHAPEAHQLVTRGHSMSVADSRALLSSLIQKDSPLQLERLPKQSKQTLIELVKDLKEGQKEHLVLFFKDKKGLPQLISLDIRQLLATPKHSLKLLFASLHREGLKNTPLVMTLTTAQQTARLMSIQSQAGTLKIEGNLEKLISHFISLANQGEISHSEAPQLISFEPALFGPEPLPTPKPIIANIPKLLSAAPENMDLATQEKHFHVLLANLDKIQHELQNKDFRYNKVSTAATHLFNKIKSSGEAFFQTPNLKSYMEFKQTCVNEIQVALKESKNHRGWHYLPSVLRGFIGCISTLLFIPALIVYLSSKQGYKITFFKTPKTNSEIDLNKIQRELSELQKEIEDHLSVEQDEPFEEGALQLN